MHRLKNGFHRQWVKCNECRWVGFYDFTKGGLGNPLRWLGCGHGVPLPLHQISKDITATEAKRLIGAKAFREAQSGQ